MHPTAYVRIPERHYLLRYTDYDDMPIFCHGGLTYFENYLKTAKNVELEGNWIGWDYGHIGDYVPYNEDFDFMKDKGKKWTTEEILEDVKDVCYQVYDLEEKRNKRKEE